MAAIQQVVDAVFLRRDGEVVRLVVDLEADDVDLEAAAARARRRGPVPVTESDVSCERWSACLNASSPTAAFDITAWMKPLPSRTWRK